MKPVCGRFDGRTLEGTMAAKDVKEVAVRPVWRTPQLESLGNLRDFVRTGGANGKSGPDADGNAMLGGESMNH